MGELVDRLGGRTPGELIRSQDWNDLVAAVEGIQTALAASIAAVDAKVDAGLAALDARVAALEAQITSITEAVQPLGQMRRLALRTERSHYLLGQTAHLVARVTDLRGEALSLSDPATRPWVDFVATAGKLQRDPAFTSVGGEGDQAMSVRVNEQGEARVFLVSEEDDEDEDSPGRRTMAATLETRVPETNLSIAETFLSAATPQDAQVTTAFRAISRTYDQVAARDVRLYLDRHFTLRPKVPPIIAIDPPILIGRWRDRRYTVLAFVQGDNEPGTAEPNQGASSIQVRFRDWIGPWFHLDYVREIGPIKEAVKERFRPKIDRNAAATAERIKLDIKESVRGKGLLGRQREFLAITQGLDEVSVADPPPFLPALTATLKNAVGVQQAFEQGAVAGAAGGGEVTFEAIADAGTRGEVSRGELRRELTAELRQEVTRVTQEVETNVSRSLLADNGPLLREDSPLLREDSPVRKILTQQITPLRQRLNAIQQVDPEAIARRGEVGVIDTRLKNIEAVIQRLGPR